MLEQEQGRQNKKHSPFTRTKSKFSLTKIHKRRHHAPSQQQIPAVFNDPLYEHLDGEVTNKEQHNFGPWVEHQRKKSRQRLRVNIGGGELPVIYRPQDTASRYFNQLDNQNYENIDNLPLSLPHIRERGQRAFSLQNLRPASLMFHPDELEVRQGRVTGARTPFYLKMQGYVYPKGEVDPSKKSNFIYNYCLQEDTEKMMTAKTKVLPLKQAGNYLKLIPDRKSLMGQASTNQQLLLELKQHRINKVK